MREAAIELRNDVAVKILNNLASDNNEEQDIMLTSILTEHDTLEDYVESLKKSARPLFLTEFGAIQMF